MPLVAGQHLSFYEILGSLGAGAMGDVYRARDTRLDREVAIKVLPAEFVDDEERVGRFEREAQSLAALNHPNVAGIHGVDLSGDVCFLALELVPGEDLETRLTRGPLPVDEALDVCRQIAAGLEAAHAAGIVHRDLKPANVRLTPEGKVKVLDFGIAKSTTHRSGSGLATTAVGLILGTPTTMSPEQALGRPVDARTDVWALGCVLYDCLTGRRPFEGKTIPDVLLAVTKQEPDWSVLPAETPVRVRRLLERCLTKDVHHRLQAAGEARIVLADPGGAPSEEPARAVGVGLPLAIGIGVAALLGYFLGSRTPDPSELATIRLGLELPVGQRLDLPNPRSGGLDGLAPPLAISAAGDALVYLARGEDGPTGLYLRRLDSFEAPFLDGTENAEAPFFSPDGEWVGFFRDEGLFRVAVRGGSTPILICSLPIVDRPSGTWGQDDTIVFSRGLNAEGRLERIAASGGEPEELTEPDSAAGEAWHGLPQFLPGGEAILFTVAARDGTHAAVVDLASRERQLIAGTGEAAGARYLAAEDGGAGLLLFAQAGRILAAGCDLDARRLTGPPWSVVEQVSSSALGVGHWACSENGTFAYVSGNVAESELVLVDRTGAVTWRAPELGVYQHPRLSDDGERLLYDRLVSGGRDIWMMDLVRDIPRRLTSEYVNMDPLWAPDDERVLFSRFVDNVRSLHLVDTGRVGAEPRRLMPATDENQIAGTWSPSGELLFTVFSSRSQEDLWLLPSLDAREASALLEGDGRQGFGAISPDGHSLAYVSDESGQLEVYLCSYPELSGKLQLTSGGGSEPLWSRDGEELFFRIGADFFAAPVERGGASEAGASLGEPVQLFSGAYDDSPTGHQHYDVSKDGERFALVKKLPSETRSELRVILNWRPSAESTGGR